MSASLIAFLVAAGFTVWIWTQLNRRTGNADAKSAALTAGAAGVAAFIVLFTLLKITFKL